MSRNTLFFIILLAALAVLLGIVKYVVAPKYVANLTTQQASPTPVVAPQPASSPGLLADTADAKVLALLNQMTDDQKIAQVIALSIQDPVSSNSAMLTSLLKNEPGFMTLVASKVSTASAQKSLHNLIATNLPKKSVPVLFSLAQTGSSPILCAADLKCAAALKKNPTQITFSEPLPIASGSATASSITGIGDTAAAQFHSGFTVVTLGPKTTQEQITSLIDQLVLLYNSDDQFKNDINKNLITILRLKEVYY